MKENHEYQEHQAEHKHEYEELENHNNESKADLLDQINELSQSADFMVIDSEELLQRKLAEIQQEDSPVCSRPCDLTASTCFIKEVPTDLIAVSSQGSNVRADFSRLSCFIEPCVANATVNIPGCPIENVQVQLNAVRVVGAIPYWFNFSELFVNGCSGTLERITAAGQGTANVNQTLCYIPADELECPVDLCRSQIQVQFRQFILCEDKYYVVYQVNFVFPSCP